MEKQISLFSYKKKPPKKTPDLRTLRRNIRRVYARAHEVERAWGQRWYRDAHETCKRWGQEFGIPTEVVAHIVAALSPNSRWERNLKDARAVLEGRPGYQCSTYGRNVVKAREILRRYREATRVYTSDHWNLVLRGPKVTAFAANIARPDEDHEVTIDFHALSIAFGFRFTTKSVPKINETLYARLALAYRSVARELRLRPQELQAVTWVTWKRLYKV